VANTAIHVIFAGLLDGRQVVVSGEAGVVSRVRMRRHGGGTVFALSGK